MSASTPPVDGPPLPPAEVFEAPVAWRTIDFVSDLHLSDELPATRQAFFDYLRDTPADAVILLGDVVDLWVGDDSAEEGFERGLTQELAEAARGRSLAFMAGNRDFMIGDGWLQRVGVRRLADPTLLIAFGRRVLLSHGDALCLADREYQQFRRQVRDPDWQRQALSRPLAERRALAGRMRHGSEARRRSGVADAWADVDVTAALQLLRDAGSATLVHGHTHRPETSGPLDDRHDRLVLSDWDLDDDEAARGDVLRLTTEGWHRLSPAAAVSAS